MEPLGFVCVFYGIYCFNGLCQGITSSTYTQMMNKVIPNRVKGRFFGVRGAFTSAAGIVGAQIGLHPVLTLISMFVGNHLFGIVGLFGLPILLSLLRYLNDTGTISLFPASALGKPGPETAGSKPNHE